MDSNHTILKSALKFFSGTALSRITGYLRDVSMAFCYGTSPAIAAFLASFRLAQVPRRLLGEGSMQTSFIPHYEEIKHECPEKARQFFIDLNGWLALILASLIIFSITVLFFLPHIFPFSPDAQEIISLTLFMTPGLFFICLYGLNTGLLECEKSYFTPSVAPIGFNLIWIGGCFAFAFLPVNEAMKMLALSITLASFAQWAVTMPKVLKILEWKWRPFNFSSPQVRKLWKPLLLANIGVIAVQINSGLDPLFARYANLQGPAWLWYAIRIEQVPIALFGIALQGALFPPLSRAAKKKDWHSYHHFLKNALLKSICLMIPITALIYLLGEWGIKVFFGHGDFNQESVLGTTHCLWGYGIGLLPQTLVLILAPAYYARGNYKTPAIGSVLSVVANILFNTIAIFGFHMGPESVAYATSLASVINLLFLGIMYRKFTLELSPT